MLTTVQTLEMTPAEFAGCKTAIEQIAYFKWLDAGSPSGRALDFWLAAEREWLERHYVPNRNVSDNYFECDDELQRTFAPEVEPALLETCTHGIA